MAWHILASEQLQDIVPEKPITSTKLITLSFTFNSKHKRDLTNFAESVMDLMVDLEILEDDNLFVCPKVNLEFIGFGKDEDGIGWTDVNIEENV
jgi:Holliday junction resolvase RusA-like endonuclease